ncbi:MAG: hypothetical protein ABIJ21_02150 [Nanoarchaeota archaeon]
MNVVDGIVSEMNTTRIVKWVSLEEFSGLLSKYPDWFSRAGYLE